MYRIGDIVIYCLPAAVGLLALLLALAAWAAFRSSRRRWQVPGLAMAFLAPLLMAATVAGLPIAPTNAIMMLYPSWQYFAVLRLGVNKIGDAPPQWFVPGSAACTVSGGDVGSQVPTADGGCLIAVNGVSRGNLLEYGADPTGVAPSDSQMAAALAAQAANGGVPIHVPVGVFAFLRPIAVTASNADIECQNEGATSLVETTDNTNLLTWGSATYQTDQNPIYTGIVRNCTLINEGTGSITPTSGAVIAAYRVAGLKIQNNTIRQGFQGVALYGNPATYQTSVNDNQVFGLNWPAPMPGSSALLIDKAFVCTPGSGGCSVAGSVQDPTTGQYFKAAEGAFIQQNDFYGGGGKDTDWGIDIAEDDGTLIQGNYVGGYYGADLLFEVSTPASGYIDEVITGGFYDQGNGPGSNANTVLFAGNPALGLNGITGSCTYSTTSTTISCTGLSGTLVNGQGIADPELCGGGSSPCLSRIEFLYDVAQTGSSATAQMSYTGTGGAITGVDAANNGSGIATTFNAYGSFQGFLFAANRVHCGQDSCIRFDSTVAPGEPKNVNLSTGVCAYSGGAYTNDCIDVFGSPNYLSINGWTMYLSSPGVGINIANGQNLQLNNNNIDGGSVGINVSGATTSYVYGSNNNFNGQTDQDILVSSTLLTAGVFTQNFGETGTNTNPTSECTATVSGTEVISYSPACTQVLITGSGEVEGINTDPTQPMGRMNANPGQPVTLIIGASVSFLNCSTCSGSTNIRMNSTLAAPGSTLSLGLGDYVFMTNNVSTFEFVGVVQP